MNNAVMCIVILIFTVIVQIGLNKYAIGDLKEKAEKFIASRAAQKGQDASKQSENNAKQPLLDNPEGVKMAFGFQTSLRKRNEPIHKMMHVDGFTNTTAFMNSTVFVSDNGKLLAWYV
jgi:hypothetical protein